MQSSYRVFRLFGVSVELHITFIIIFFLFLFGASFYGLLENPTAGLIGGVKVFALFILLFGTILIHEFAHSLVALRNGVRVPRITLTPIGGAANIDVPENPKLEFKLAVAGPLTNFVLLFMSLAVLYMFWPDFLLTPEFLGYFDIGNVDVTYFYLDNIFRDILVIPNIFAITAVMNFLLGVFNLIPAFPMDGGRVLRSILALWIDYVKATRIAVHVGQIIAVLMFTIGLWHGPILILISFFIFFTGSSELRVVRIKHILHDMTLRDIAVSDIRYVSESATVRDFLDSTACPTQTYYPVTDFNRRVTGMLYLGDLKGRGERDFDRILVKDLAGRKLDTVDASLRVEEQLPVLLTKDFILVVDSGRVIGYLTPEHLSEIVRFYGITGR